MADMIRRQQKSAGPICILTSEHTNSRDAAKQKLYQQLASAIRCRFDFHLFECFAVFLRSESYFFRLIPFFNVVS